MTKSILVSGSGFTRNKFNGNRIQTQLRNREKTSFVPFSQWCENNFISKRIGRQLLAKHLLIGQRLGGRWWVCANKDCLEELTDYLQVEELFFDANN